MGGGGGANESSSSAAAAAAAKRGTGLYWHQCGILDISILGGGGGDADYEAVHCYHLFIINFTSFYTYIQILFSINNQTEAF